MREIGRALPTESLHGNVIQNDGALLPDQCGFKESQMATEQEMLAALDNAAAAVASVRLRESDAAGLCDKYKEIKKWILIFLPWIAKIPGVGPKIVAILEFFMMLADKVCPAT